MDNSFFSFTNLKCVLWSFFKGLTDSLKFKDVFSHDEDIDRAEKMMQANIKKEFLLNRESPQRDLENIAKRRAVERREQLESAAKSVPHAKSSNEPKIRERIIKCCILNGLIFWVSIFLFDKAVIPLVQWMVIFCFDQSYGQYLFNTINPLLNLIFTTLWVLPIYLMSKIVNAIWFADIADVAFKKSASGRPRPMSSLSLSVADTIFSIVIEIVFLVQGIACSYLIPLGGLGQFVNLVHMCLLHALYCFEYKWYNQGFELHKRLAIIENHWPYFLGFGLPLAVCTSFPSSIVISGCVFSILFPLFIVSANQAQVIVQQRDVPLRIFHPTIVISNFIFAKTLRNSTNDSSNPPRPVNIRQIRR